MNHVDMLYQAPDQMQ